MNDIERNKFNDSIVEVFESLCEKYNIDIHNSEKQKTELDGMNSSLVPYIQGGDYDFIVKGTGYTANIDMPKLPVDVIEERADDMMVSFEIIANRYYNNFTLTDEQRREVTDKVVEVYRNYDLVNEGRENRNER